jgi:hypothetical protein
VFFALTNLPYTFTPPIIKSGSVYLFTTDSGIDYEVRFARKKDYLLHATIAFGVLNDEFDGEEYSLTNKGEVYRVMATIVEIVKTYMREHPNVRIYEFVGEPRADEEAEFPRKRLNLYSRYLPKIFDRKWRFELHGNKMMIVRQED